MIRTDVPVMDSLHLRALRDEVIQFKGVRCVGTKAVEAGVFAWAEETFSVHESPWDLQHITEEINHISAADIN